MKKSLAIISSIIISAGSLSGCGGKSNKKSIDINKYTECTFSGCDTKGTVKAEIDYDSLVEENYRAFGLDKGYSYSDVFAVKLTLQGLEGEFDSFTDLSNGDNIKFVWDNDSINEVEKEYSIKIKHTDKNFLVEGLQEVEIVDPFDDIEVSFSDIAPNGRAIYQFKDGINEVKYGQGLNLFYSFDKNDGLSNGDKVTLTVKVKEEKLADNGYAFEPTEKEYTVSGLPSYISKLDEIPSETMDKMKKQIEDHWHAHIAGNWSETESLKGMTYIGSYFLKPKSGFSTISQNIVHLIYKMDVENSEGAFSYYTYGTFSNIMMLDDETCSVNLSNYTAPNLVTSFDKGKYYYIGYENLDSMFSELVTAEIADYEYENTVKE